MNIYTCTNVLWILTFNLILSFVDWNLFFDIYYLQVLNKLTFLEWFKNIILFIIAFINLLIKILVTIWFDFVWLVIIKFINNILAIWLINISILVNYFLFKLFQWILFIFEILSNNRIINQGVCLPKLFCILIFCRFHIIY